MAFEALNAQSTAKPLFIFTDNDLPFFARGIWDWTKQSKGTLSPSLSASPTIISTAALHYPFVIVPRPLLEYLGSKGESRCTRDQSSFFKAIAFMIFNHSDMLFFLYSSLAYTGRCIKCPRNLPRQPSHLICDQRWFGMWVAWFRWNPIKCGVNIS